MLSDEPRKADGWSYAVRWRKNLFGRSNKIVMKKVMGPPLNLENEAGSCGKNHGSTVPAASSNGDHTLGS